MADFHPRGDDELQRLTDDELIAHVIAARDACDHDGARRAIAILAFGYWRSVAVRVAIRVPREDIDDVTAEVIESALGSAFDGRSLGEFRSWLQTITARRIADFHRRREGKPAPEPLPEEHEGDEEIWGEAGMTPSQTGAVQLGAVVAEALDELNPTHRQVVRLYGPNATGFMELSARETAEQIERGNPGESMSEANVHQIWRRFKKRIGELLDEAEEAGDG